MLSDLINGDLDPYIHFSVDSETSGTYMSSITFLLFIMLWLHRLPACSLHKKDIFSLIFLLCVTSLLTSIICLLLLRHFSRVRLCVTPQMSAHQALLPLGFSRQEHWSGLPFPSPMHESEVAQSCPILSDPMDCSLPGSSIHGIFQARVLEWGAIAFSA